MNLDKLPPQATELEDAVIGAILIDKDGYSLASNILTENSFYKENNKTIFKAITLLYQENSKIDILTITERLIKLKKLNDIGGAYYITQLTYRVASAHNIEDHAKIVQEKFLKREVIRLSSILLNNSYDDSVGIFDLTNNFLEYAYEINNFKHNTTNLTNTQLLEKVENKIKAAKEKRGVTGVATGFYELDRCTGGYQKTDLIIKAARPSMGKTAQALCEAMYMAHNSNKRVLFFSLEMSAEQLMSRMVSIQTEISNTKIKSGELEDYDWEVFKNKTEVLKSENLIIYDRINKLQEIIKASKKEQLKGGVDAIFVDYLQIITGVKNNNREQEISEISSSLKRLAKEVDCPLICLSQLSRAVETRGGNKKPMLSDLRDSGSIEQDADIVQFLYRPEYYGFENDSDGNSTEGKAYMLIKKNRNGALKDIEFNFIGNLTKFTDKTIEQPSQIKPNTEFDLN